MLVLVGLAVSHVARAGEEGDETELAPGETAYGQEKGELELAFEALYANGVDEDEIELRVALEYGLTSRIQVGLDLPYVFVDPEDEDVPEADGFDAAELAFQFALLGADAPLALAFEIESEIPIAGREGPGSDDVKAAGAFLLAWVHGHAEVFGGVKGTWSSEPTEVELELGGVFVTGRIATEIAATWTDAGHDTEWELKPEVTIEDLGPFDLAIGFPYAFLDGRDEWGVAATLTWGYP
jgi:hypothetical protein